MNRLRSLALTTVVVLMTLVVTSVALSTRLESPATSPADREAPMNNVSVKVFNDRGELVGPISTPRVVKSDAEWKRQLTPQYEIARGKGTERAFCGTLLDNHQDGVYACVCCGLPLFSSDSKFNVVLP